MIVLTDSSLALSIKPQVLTTTILWSFFVLSCTTSISLARSWPLSTSLSTMFLLQPSVMMLTLSFFNVFVFITGLFFQAEEAVYEFMFVKDQKVFHFLAHADELHRYFELVGNGQHD